MTARSKRYSKRLIGLVIVIALLLVFAELGLRFYVDRFGTQDQKIYYIYDAEAVALATGRFQPQPYTNFGLSPNYNDHNSRGYRGDEFVVPKPDGVYRIVALGDSTVYGNGITDWRLTYPAQLQTLLREQGYSNVEVINASVGGYASYDILAQFIYRILDLEPDMVIVYQATNDVSLRLVPPEYFTSENVVRGVWSHNYAPLPTSALYRFVGIRLKWIPVPGVEDTWHVEPTEPVSLCLNNCEISGDELIATNDTRYFERNMRSLIVLAQTNNVAVMLSTWAYYPEATMANYMTQAYRVRGITETNDVIRRLAEEYETLFCDFQKEIPLERNYWQEGVHLTEQGTAEQARQYATYLIGSGSLAK